jgi:hypothetical protein
VSSACLAPASAYRPAPRPAGGVPAGGGFLSGGGVPRPGREPVGRPPREGVGPRRGARRSVGAGRGVPKNYDFLLAAEIEARIAKAFVKCYVAAATG